MWSNVLPTPNEQIKKIAFDVLIMKLKLTPNGTQYRTAFTPHVQPLLTMTHTPVWQDLCNGCTDPEFDSCRELLECLPVSISDPTYNQLSAQYIQTYLVDADMSYIPSLLLRIGWGAEHRTDKSRRHDPRIVRWAPGAWVTDAG